MVVNKIIQQIMSLGFSENEAKAYVSLIKIQPATAYEISRDSGIPSSKIYGIIARLVEKNVFAPMIEGEKKKYVPMMPDEFIESRRSQFDEVFNQLKQDLPGINQTDGVSYIWNLYDYDYLLDKARRMISETGESILISLWREEFSQLEEALSDAEKRGVKIAVVHFGMARKKLGQLFQHPIKDTLYQERGGRGFNLVCDSNTALSGTVTKNLQAEGAWSHNLGFVTTAEDYIKHDIYIMKIVSRFDEKLIKTFGDRYHLLRDIFSDKETE